MVPFIDVMLVLLIIFMVTAPLITTGVVDLPSVGKAKQRPDHVIEVVRRHRREAAPARRRQGQPAAADAGAAGRARARRRRPATPRCRWSSAPTSSVKYEAVVRVMDTLQRAGVQRVGLSVKQGG